MAETHHVSFVGNQTALAALLRELHDASLVDAKTRAFVDEQQRRDPAQEEPIYIPATAQEEPIYIPATGEEGVTTDKLADILHRFNKLHNGSARAHDAGQLPNTHTIDYVGDPQGEQLLINLLVEQDLSVEDEAEQDDWPPPIKRTADRPGDVAVTLIVYGWNGMDRQVTAAIDTFRQSHRGRAVVKDLGPA